MFTRSRTRPMDHIGQILNNRTRQTASALPSAEPRSQVVTLRTDTQAKQKLAAMLSQCFQSLKLYGKEPEAFEGTVAMFNLVLADYPIARSEQALVFYLKHNPEMPPPADIANIINRGNK